MGGRDFGHVSGAYRFGLSLCRLIVLQPEFRPILFPIFCHFYLDLIQFGYKDAGTELYFPPLCIVHAIYRTRIFHPVFTSTPSEPSFNSTSSFNLALTIPCPKR